MSAGRSLEFDPDTALDAAVQVFRSQGYEATSLQDLLETMGIARSSFYHAFGSKRELFLRALERYRDGLAQQLRQSLSASGSGMAFVRNTLESVASSTARRGGRRGCLVFNSAVEFGQSDPQIAAQVAASIEVLGQVFCEAIRRAQREGDIDARGDPELLGRYVVCTMSGLGTLAKAGASRLELENLARLALAALDSLTQSAVAQNRIVP